MEGFSHGQVMGRTGINGLIRSKVCWCKERNTSATLPCPHKLLSLVKRATCTVIPVLAINLIHWGGMFYMFMTVHGVILSEHWYAHGSVHPSHLNTCTETRMKWVRLKWKIIVFLFCRWTWKCHLNHKYNKQSVYKSCNKLHMHCWGKPTSTHLFVVWKWYYDQEYGNIRNLDKNNRNCWLLCVQMRG